MTGHLDLNQIQLAAIVQSTKGIISRIPRGLEKLKCVRITHLEGLEYLDVWATDRYCVLHLVIHCSAAACRSPGTGRPGPRRRARRQRFQPRHDH